MAGNEKQAWTLISKEQNMANFRPPGEEARLSLLSHVAVMKVPLGLNFPWMWECDLDLSRGEMPGAATPRCVHVTVMC